MKALLVGLITALSISTSALALPKLENFGEVRQQVFIEGWTPVYREPDKTYQGGNPRTTNQLNRGYLETVSCDDKVTLICVYMYANEATNKYMVIFTVPHPSYHIHESAESENPASQIPFKIITENL